MGGYDIALYQFDPPEANGTGLGPRDRLPEP